MTAYETLASELLNGATIIIDGATGTELEYRGAAMHSEVWCAMATETAPDTLKQVHEDYIRAGARVITTNTYSSSLNMLGPAKLSDRFESLNRNAVAIAREARRNLGAEAQVAIAGSVSHQMPFSVRQRGLRGGVELPSQAVIRSNAAALIDILLDAGVDFLVLEMMYDPWLAVPTMEAAFASGAPVWLGLSCATDDAGQPRARYDPSRAFDEVLDELLPCDASAAGIMHSSVNVTAQALQQIEKRFGAPMLAYPDSGHFKMPNWQFEEVIDAAELVTHALKWQRLGARILGGCCGLGVRHIKALSAEFNR